MAILQMNKICIAALRKERKKLLEAIQRREDIHVIDTSLGEGEVFYTEDTSSMEDKFNASIRLATQAREILETYYPEIITKVSQYEGRKLCSADEYDAFSSRYKEIVSIAYQLEDYHTKIIELSSQLTATSALLDTLGCWLTFSLPFNYQGTDKTTCLKGMLPDTWTKDAIISLLTYEDGSLIPAEVEIISAQERYTCVAIYILKQDAERSEQILRSHEFVPPTISSSKTPIQLKEELEAKIDGYRQQIEELTATIGTYTSYRNDFFFLEDYDRLRLEKYQVIQQSLSSKSSFILNGYATKRSCAAIKADLERDFTCVVEIQEIPEDEDMPIQLDNPGFAAPLEDTVASYALPSKGEIDPTLAISFFHYILFGLMLSDAGYGLLMVLGCAFVLIRYRKTIELATKRNMQMFLYCGIATVFWGVLFGSYFGDLPDTIARTFWHIELHTPALWFFPINDPMRLLAFSMVFGLVHLFTGLGLKAYQTIRQRQFQELVYDVLFWFGLLISSIIILLNTSMVQSIFSYQVSFPPILMQVSNIVAIICAIGIILTNGRDSKNPAVRIMKGAYALYGISGWLSDVLSYARLLALGLATGVIASVINLMAAMVGASGSIISIILFIIICGIGHTLNLGINALGAYVHAVRLEYVEFFGKFYEGGGNPFKPFGMNTKYFKFKENMKNE